MSPSENSAAARSRSFLETWIASEYSTLPKLAEFRLASKSFLEKLTRQVGTWAAFLPPLKFKPKMVGTFLPRASWDEPALLPNFGSQVLYPSLTKGQLSFKSCHQNDLRLSPRWGVLEAPAEAPSAEPDLVLTPCFLADKQGNRIGRGGGFYDQYFQRNPRVYRLGVLHSDFLMNSIPSEWLHSGDQALHGVITEKEFFQIKEFI